ncbi:hypothetical protein ACNKHL_00575 [Shigella flexneri]
MASVNPGIHSGNHYAAHLPMEFWQRYSAAMLLDIIILLMIVLVVGSWVKGASH